MKNINFNPPIILIDSSKDKIEQAGDLNVFDLKLDIFNEPLHIQIGARHF